MAQHTGSIQVSTENIFPIIRKWLYSDHDILDRELIANATDAIYKIERLDGMGEAKLPSDTAFQIEVVYDSAAKTLAFVDNGVGMTLDEVNRYINDIAYSGALDFVQRYQAAGEDKGGIIGHFGLGFYSAFMVADRVSIDTLSYLEDAKPVHWQSDNGMDFVLYDGTDQPADVEVRTKPRTSRGTTITIELSEEALKTFDADHLLTVMKKYCAFMPRPIYFNDVVGLKQKAEDHARYTENLMKAYEERKQKALDAGEAFEEPVPTPYPTPEPVLINAQEPLWLKAPAQCSEADYKAFYHSACGEMKDPLFWIHLNMDYPFALKGILYFPEMENRYQALDGRIKLYSNQVFVADNMKDVIPDFLFLLKGFIDCPELPLNVSRSYLQNDGYVNKLSSHIVRKVADKLKAIFAENRSAYDQYWSDIHVFIKYGVMRDEKFFERMKPALIFKTDEEKYLTLEELGEQAYYTVAPETQVSYIKRAKNKGHQVLVMDDELDVPFMSFLESKCAPLKFMRIDTDLEAEAGKSDWQEDLTALFKTAAGSDQVVVSVKAHGADELPVLLIETEESRRNLEMRKMFEKMQGKNQETDWESMFPIETSLQINTDSPVIEGLIKLNAAGTHQDKVAEVARHLYDLARLSHGSLKGDDFDAFLKRDVKWIDCSES